MAKKYVTEVIGDQYKEWKPGTAVLIATPPSSGKTTWVRNQLVEYCRETGKKVLYLSPRTLINNETKAVCTDDDVMTIMSCQRLIREHVNVGSYDYIVVDEAHWLVTGGECWDRDVVFEQVADSQAVKIYMTGTPDVLIPLLSGKHPQMIKIDEVAFDTSYMDVKITNSHNDALAAVCDAVAAGEKVMYVTYSKKKLLALQKMLGRAVAVVTSDNRDQIELTDGGTYTMPEGCSVIAGTSCLSLGINVLSDSGVTTLVIDLPDPTDAVQAIYRRRVKEGERLTVIIRDWTVNELKILNRKSIQDAYEAYLILRADVDPRSLGMSPTWGRGIWGQTGNMCVRYVGRQIDLSACEYTRCAHQAAVINRMGVPGHRWIDELTGIREAVARASAWEPTVKDAEDKVRGEVSTKLEQYSYGQAVEPKEIAALIGCPAKQRSGINEWLKPYGYELRLKRTSAKNLTTLNRIN